jgi:uncharacterized protein with von Willebrand factor type A (vWA) domain
MTDEDLSASKDASWLNEEFSGPSEGSGWRDEANIVQQTPSKYGLKLDKWGQRKGEDLSALKEFQALKTPEEDVSDMFGMAFDYEPQMNEACDEKHKLEYLKSMLDNADYQALRNSTRLDDMASELAALQFTQVYVTYKTQREKEDQKREKDGKGEPDAKEQLRQEMKTAAAVGKAVGEAAKEVGELNDARSALGIGSEHGATAGMSPADVKKMFMRVKNNKGLRDVLDKAGRYRLAARAKQQNKVKHGFDDMIGVTYSNDISRILPVELAYLAHPVLKIDAIRRFAEGQMASREYRGVENVAKGPIIVIIDESGSMAGDRIANAKGLALAMAWVARHQKRWCGFIGFSGRGQVRSLALPPDKWPADSVMKWLEGFLNGGTDLPLREIPRLYDEMGAPKGKTDLICITDGDTGSIQANEKQAFDAWRKKAQCKFIGITIASAAQILQSISDEFYRIPSLSPDNMAVERVIGI